MENPLNCFNWEHSSYLLIWLPVIHGAWDVKSNSDKSEIIKFDITSVEWLLHVPEGCDLMYKITLQFFLGHSSQKSHCDPDNRDNETREKIITLAWICKKTKRRKSTKTNSVWITRCLIAKPAHTQPVSEGLHLCLSCTNRTFICSSFCCLFLYDSVLNSEFVHFFCRMELVFYWPSILDKALYMNDMDIRQINFIQFDLQHVATPFIEAASCAPQALYSLIAIVAYF